MFNHLLIERTPLGTFVADEVRNEAFSMCNDNKRIAHGSALALFRATRIADPILRNDIKCVFEKAAKK